MVPLSLGRTSSLGASSRAIHDSLAWLSPANIASASSAERRALIGGLAAFVALSVAIAFAHVWTRLQVVDLGYHLSATHRVIDRLEQEGQELAVEAATLDSPNRIEEIARTRLGMMHPEKGVEAILP
jgi:cell division protein FtsL